MCKELGLRGFNRKPEDIKHWDLRESLTEEETRAAHEIMCSPGFVTEMPWYPGARGWLNGLHSEESVHIVTAPFRNSPTWMLERLEWLRPFGDRVHFVSGRWKQLVQGDVLVEDHPENARAWLQANPKGIAVLIDRPWNQPGAKEWAMHMRMYRAASYEEALHIIRECT